MIAQVEFVSSHFRYTEEYVLSHSPAWVNRKSKQAREEQYEQHTQRVMESFKGIALIVDSIFNKGQNWSELLPPSLEDALKMQGKTEEKPSQFIEGTWWKRD
jgi:hypothetical protein